MTRELDATKCIITRTFTFLWMIQISIPLDDSDNRLYGEFFNPKTAKGLIVFARGSWSGRASPRNQYVANVPNQKGFATFQGHFNISKV